jgi:hypothetical protein
LLTSLKLTNNKLGLLINFNLMSVEDGTIRIVNNQYYQRNSAKNSAKICVKLFETQRATVFVITFPSRENSLLLLKNFYPYGNPDKEYSFPRPG